MLLSGIRDRDKTLIAIDEEVEAHRAEIGQLREENVKLRADLAAMKDLLKDVCDAMSPRERADRQPADGTGSTRSKSAHPSVFKLEHAA